MKHYNNKKYEGQRKKLKQRIITHAKVKNQFTKKVLLNQDEQEFIKTPDFYNEIFAEVDQMNKEKGNNYRETEEVGEGNRSEEESGDEGEDSIENETITQKRENKREDKKLKTEKKSKPNPFKRSLNELEEQKKELEKIKEEAKLEKERIKKEIEQKNKDRKKQKYKLTRRNKRGQPILANQLDAILDKLKK